MPIFRDIPPTAGFPLHARDIAAGFLSLRSPDLLAADVKQYLGIPYTRTTCSGTAALYFICCALHSLTPRRTIITPSFICPLVPLAVHRAGFRVVVADINERDFHYAPRILAEVCAASGDIAAIVANHLGGIPIDLAALRSVARQHECFIIEDCAQALGALSQGCRVGTLGDFAFFSFAAGKGMTMYEGGMMATRHAAYAPLLDAAATRHAHSAVGIEARRILELFGYWLFYRPSLFWFVFTMPQKLWLLCGNDISAFRENFDAAFPLHAVSRFRIGVARTGFAHLESRIAQQRDKAAWYIRALETCPAIHIVLEMPGDRATYPYVTVVFDDPAARDRALRHSSRLGAGVSQIYARAIGDYPYLRGIVSAGPCDNARLMARRSLTLSTSAFLTKKDAAAVTDAIKKAL